MGWDYDRNQGAFAVSIAVDSSTVLRGRARASDVELKAKNTELAKPRVCIPGETKLHCFWYPYSAMLKFDVMESTLS
jgi:hypothetical protein